MPQTACDINAINVTLALNNNPLNETPETILCPVVQRIRDKEKTFDIRSEKAWLALALFMFLYYIEWTTKYSAIREWRRFLSYPVSQSSKQSRCLIFAPYYN